MHLPDAIECLADFSSLRKEFKELVADIKNVSISDIQIIIPKLFKDIEPTVDQCIDFKNELVILGKDFEQCFTNTTRIE